MTVKNLLPFGIIAGAGIAVVVAILAISHSHTTPPVTTVQQAAQQSVAAIVTVEHADTALAQHRVDSLRIVVLTRANSTLTQRVAGLKASSDTLLSQYLSDTMHNRDNTTLPPDQTRRNQQADSTIYAERRVLITQDTLLAVKDSMLGVAQADNAGLTVALHATRDTLATHRQVVIPASAIRGPSFLSKLAQGIGNHLGVTAGYGAQLASNKVTTGWQLTAGIHIPL